MCHPRFCPRYPIGRCVTGNGGVRGSRDNVPSPCGVVVRARADTTTPSTKAVGAQNGTPWSTQVQRPGRKSALDENYSRVYDVPEEGHGTLVH
jgi:hypothetical protein